MHNPFPQIWKDEIAALPPVSELTIAIVPNHEAERLSCIVCNLGHEERGRAPEWTVLLRSPYESVNKGLHERCRKRSERKPSP